MLALNHAEILEAILTNFTVEQLRKGGRKSNQRRSSVEDGSSVVQIGALSAKADRVEVDLPVSLAAEGNLDHLARIVRLVNTTEGRHRLLLCVAKVESKHFIIKETLIDHVVEGRRDVVDGDGIVTEAEDTIEPAESEGKTRLRCGFTKQLILDLQVTDAESILGDESGNLA
jgi:hypothetical protein